MTLMLVEFVILLACIVIGARLGGIALGTMGGIGLAIFVFAFAMPPGSPPATVLGMILAVITALSMMEAAGGLDFLVETAEGVLHRNPKRITFLAPLVTYLLIFAAGTQHVIYALLPVIAEVARKAGIRPERPMSMSVIAAQHGLIASPVAAATVALVAALEGLDVKLPQIMMVTIPATLIGILAGTLSVAWKGKELDQDPDYERHLASGQIKPPKARARLEGEARRPRRDQSACHAARFLDYARQGQSRHGRADECRGTSRDGQRPVGYDCGTAWPASTQRTRTD